VSEENFFLTSKSLKSLKNQIHRSGSSQNNDVRHFQNHICKLRRYSLFTSIWYIYYITTHRYFITVETEDSTIFRNPYKSISTVRRYRTPWRLNFQFTSLWNNSGTGLFSVVSVFYTWSFFCYRQHLISEENLLISGHPGNLHAIKV